MRISVIAPMFNEEENLQNTLSKVEIDLSGLCNSLNFFSQVNWASLKQKAIINKMKSFLDISFKKIKIT